MNLIKTFQKYMRQEWLLLILLGVLLLVAMGFEPNFLKAKSQLKLSENIWELAILCLPMTLIIITGGIDLSIGSTMALATVAFGMGFEANWPLWACALAALLASLAAGAVNGALIAGIKVHPLIVTLATLAAYRGIAEGLSKGFSVSPLPESFQALSGSFLGAPIAAWIFIVLAIVFYLFLAHTPWGRFCHAIGHNEQVCRFSGAPTSKIIFSLYVVSAGLAGIAALLYSARRNTANPEAGYNMELDVITAVVIGGTSIYGGRGTIYGTLIGIVLIHEMREFFNWRWSSDELNLIVVGSLLIGSVLFYQLMAPKGKETK
ncbi:ABC transporter permease [Candidatus Sumerlaeota bacterium]|nr:ABC transporter permease [Candidatus Sumerlaeota bacterium]